MSLSLTFLSSHSNNAAILSYTVAVLARLLMTNSDEIISAMSDVLEREGFVENLCNGMKRFLWNDRIQTYGCVVLYEAATLGDFNGSKCVCNISLSVCLSVCLSLS